MPAEAGGYVDVFVGRVAINDEMVVGRHGVHAHCVLSYLRRGSRQVSVDEARYGFEVGVMDDAVDRCGVVHDVAAGMFGHFHSVLIHDRESVKEAFPCVKAKGGPPVSNGVGAVCRIHPEHDLAADVQRQMQVGQERARPGAGADHEMVGAVCVTARLHDHTVAARRPSGDAVSYLEGGPFGPGLLDVDPHAVFNGEVSGVGFEEGRHLIARSKARELFAHVLQ